MTYSGLVNRGTRPRGVGAVVPVPNKGEVRCDPSSTGSSLRHGGWDGREDVYVSNQCSLRPTRTRTESCVGSREVPFVTVLVYPSRHSRHLCLCGPGSTYLGGFFSRRLDRTF